MVQWTNSAGTKRPFYNFGLMSQQSIATTRLQNTSSGSTQSAVWEGTAQAGGGVEKLRVVQTVSFDVNALYFTINAVMTNTGSTTLRGLKYMRNVDPDQEQPITYNYTTRNWVEYQPPRIGVPGRPNLAARPSGNTSKALSIAEGLMYKLTLGLGTIDNRAVVAASHGFSNRDVDNVLSYPTQPLPSSPSVRDAAIVLAYELGDLAPGQSTSVTYAYILNKADLETAMGNLAAVTILQPSGTVSGNNVLYQATTDRVSKTTRVDFYVNDSLIGSDTTADAGGVFETAFNSRNFPNGSVSLRVVATFSEGPPVEKLSSATVDNSGPSVSFTTPVTGQIFSGTGIPVRIAVLDPSQPPVRVSFFRETSVSGSKFLGSDTSAPFESLFDAIDLPQGTTVVIKAVASDSLNRMTTITVTGVTALNFPPVADAGPDQTVECTGSGQAVVTLNGAGSSDPDGDVLTYTWSWEGGSASGPTPTVTLPLGPHLLTLSVSDGRLSTTDSLVIIVRDTTPPIVAAGPDVTLEAAGTAGTPFTISPIVSDSCCTTSMSVTPDIPVYPLGSTIITVTATDCAGNTSSATKVVTVQDTTPPVLTVPADVTIEATAPLSLVKIGQATASDIFGVTIGNDAPAAYPVGVTQVTWTATDANGNTSTAVQKVNVQDTTPPTVTAPSNLTVEATGPLTPVDLGKATAVDLVGVVSISSDAPAAFPLGITKVVWSGRDAAGNAGTAIQTVTVVDTTPPTLAGLVNQVLEATSPAGATASFSVTATDLVDASPIVACSPISGGTFPLGLTTVSCTATDASGNSATGNFTIMVRDTTPPVLTVPANITVLLNSPVGDPSVQAFLNGAKATDIVDTAVTVTFSSVTLDSVGAKEVVFTAVDDYGNKSTGTATIYVQYAFGGFLQPVSLLKPFKLGSTVPVKFTISDASGTIVTSAVAKFYLQRFNEDTPVDVPIEVTSTSAADIGNYFRTADGMYIFNLYTKNLTSGTYQIQAVLDDGTVNTISFLLKQ